MQARTVTDFGFGEEIFPLCVFRSMCAHTPSQTHTLPRPFLLKPLQGAPLSAVPARDTTEPVGPASRLRAATHISVQIAGRVVDTQPHSQKETGGEHRFTSESLLLAAWLRIIPPCRY
jgi:hypothetical protein